jgi:hypothetical protein
MSDDKPTLNPEAKPVPGGEGPVTQEPEVFKKRPFTGLGAYDNLPPAPELGVKEPGRPVTGLDRGGDGGPVTGTNPAVKP